MRKFIAIVSVLCFACVVASADEFMLSVKKVDGNKITGTKFAGFKKGADKTKPEEVTLTATDSVTVTKGKFDFKSKGKVEAGDAIKGGLTNKIFTKTPLMVSVVTDNDKVTAIRVLSDPNKFGATISKIDGNKITVVKTAGFGFGGMGKGKGADAPKAEPITLTVADNCKFISRSFDKESKEMKTTTLTDGLKNEALQKENARVQITVDDNNKVIELSIGAGRGGRGPGAPGGGLKKGNDKSV